MENMQESERGWREQMKRDGKGAENQEVGRIEEILINK